MIGVTGTISAPALHAKRETTTCRKRAVAPEITGINPLWQ